MSSSIFASSVCMPACPTINASTTSVHNDTTTVAQLQSDINKIPDASTRASATTELGKLDKRGSNLKKEVAYMSSHLGDTRYELDRSTLFCLCNKKKFPAFLAYNKEYNIKAMCEDSPASYRGYVELPYSDNLAQFVGDGQNIAYDTLAMDKTACAFKYRTSKAFTRCL